MGRATGQSYSRPDRATTYHSHAPARPYNVSKRQDVDKCNFCGAAVAGGADGCRALMHDLMAQAQADARYAGVYRLAFDAYCMQHPEIHGVSAKSYAAHLMGLCHGIEHAGRPQTYWAIPQWLNTPRPLLKPDLLRARGRMTVADVRGASSPEEHGRRVRAWAEHVWRAYASQQHIARKWLTQALAPRRGGRGT